MVTSSPPKAAAIPFVGEYPLLGSLPYFMTDRLAFLRRMAQVGDVRGCHLGSLPIVLFNKPEHVQSILVEHAYEFSKGRLMHKIITGNGLFISEGEFHRKQRKLIAPAFQPRRIASYADTMVHYGERLQQEWPDGAVIDLNQQMTAMTLSIIGKVLFDANVFTEAEGLGSAMSIIFAHTSKSASSLFTPPLTWPTPGNRRLLAAIQLIEERILSLIEQRRASTDERNDFLSILLRARDEDGAPMSDQQVMDECTTLFGAGHETTAAALTWTWYFLCQHPEAYQKVQQEVDSVLQGRTPTYADLPHLPYCSQVFKEAMRIYPPAAAILRETLHDIEIDGYLVPKGYNVMLSPYTMHRRSENFPDPEHFEPERFTPEREKVLPRHAYIPFGAGPRICIGNYFALMEGQLLIATLAQRATFSLLPGQHIVPDPIHNLAMRPGGKVEAVVKKR